MKLGRFPKIGEVLKIEGERCHIIDIKTTIDQEKAMLKVDIIGQYEMPVTSIVIDFKLEKQ